MELARQSRRESQPHLISAGILMASGVMYLRLLILVSLFNRQLAALLWLPFVALACGALAFGWLWTKRSDKDPQSVQSELGSKNPLELTTAFLFALLFLVMLVATQLTVQYLGKGGVDTLAAIVGISDINPFVLGMTQAAGTMTPVRVAAGAIMIATASNNVVNGIYAYSLADRKTGKLSLVFLVSLALGALVPLVWLL